MIHDLDLEMVVDVQGTLTPVFTDSDKEILDESIEMIECEIVNNLYDSFNNHLYQRDRLAIIEVARRLNANEDMLKAFMKKYQDELQNQKARTYPRLRDNASKPSQKAKGGNRVPKNSQYAQ